MRWSRDRNADKPSFKEQMEPAYASYVSVRDYVFKFLETGSVDEEFEEQSLSAKGFTTVHLAHLQLAVARKYEVPVQNVIEFLRVAIGPAGDNGAAHLFARADKLVGPFPEQESIVLLQSGAVGDKEGVGFLPAGIDNVGVARKMGDVIRFLKDSS
jgi:hypothetical protein